MRVVIISPYRFKARNKFNSVMDSIAKKQRIIDARVDEFDDNIYVAFSGETSLEVICAIPKNLANAIKDKYYDVVYIDKDYNEDEVWTIREHLVGNERKPIIFF